MEHLLTAGALKKLLAEQPISSTFSPVLQIVGMKPMSKGGINRYRLLLSDGIHTMSSAMLSQQLNPLVDSNSIGAHCLVKVTDYHVSCPAADKRVISITNCTVVKSGDDVGHKLGNPQPLKNVEQQTPGAGEPQATTAAAPLKEKPVQNKFYGGAPQSNAARNIVEKKPAPASKSPGTPGGSSRIYPIASLTPYQNRWTIKARVTSKSGVRTYSNSRGEGKFFNAVFMDESGEIKATAWKNECDQFFDALELNKVYTISKATLKTANKQFSQVDNDYEMNLTPETIITRVDDDTSSVPTMQFNFTTVEGLADKATNTLADICAVVHNTGELSTFIAKTSQREMTKRDLELVDDTNRSVRLTLWGEEAKKFPEDGSHPVIALKGGKIGDWNGRSLSCMGASTLMINPDNADAHRLRGWYDATGQTTDFTPYSSDGSGSSSGSSQNAELRTLDYIKTDQIGMKDKPDYFQCKAMPAFIKSENCMYMACPSESCNKKVLDLGDGNYRCEKCNKSGPEFKYRLLLQMKMCDATSVVWATAFQDSAEKMLGYTAAQLGEMNQQDESKIADVMKAATFRPFDVTFRSKMETYNDDSRLKTVVVRAEEINYTNYNKKLLAAIKKLIG